MAQQPPPENVHGFFELDDYGDCTAYVTSDVTLTPGGPNDAALTYTLNGGKATLYVQMIKDNGTANNVDVLRIWDGDINNPPPIPVFTQIAGADDARKFRAIRAFYDANGIAVPQGIRRPARKKAAKKKPTEKAKAGSRRKA